MPHVRQETSAFEILIDSEFNFTAQTIFRTDGYLGVQRRPRPSEIHLPNHRVHRILFFPQVALKSNSRDITNIKRIILFDSTYP